MGVWFNEKNCTYYIYFNFINSQTGFVLINTTDGYTLGVNKLFKTSDEGKHWSIVKSDSEINSLNFINANVGYGLQSTNDGFYNIEKTVDGGVNWNLFSADYFKK